MHWTLQAMIGLCLICAAGNFARFAMVRSVRITGALVCGGWLLQQAWWARFESDSLAIMLACDVLILRYIANMDRSKTGLAIACLMPVCWACYLSPGTGLWWWINWSAVAAQMALAMPWPSRQRASLSYSHGSLKPSRETGV